MKRWHICSILMATLLLAMPRALGAFEIESLPLHLILAGKTEAEPPFVWGDYLIFSAKGGYRFVGAAFEFEGFAKIHAFERNKEGVFVLALPLPLKQRALLAYRLIIDGAWVPDPVNPRRATGRETGLALSLVEVPYVSDERLGLYSHLDAAGRTARFLWKGRPGEIVTVAGDFNNWDPFLHELCETAPGVYELALPLPPGVHRYAFVVRGEYLADPLNVERATNAEGRVVSVLRVGEADTSTARR